MNLPNIITLARLGLTGACIGLLEVAGTRDVHAAGADVRTLCQWALVLFVVAAVTDFLDGWLARRLDQVTSLGRVLDPFVDKVLVCGVFIALLRFGRVQELLPHWVVIVIVAREFLVTAVRGFAESQGMAFPADWFGKIKMAAQSVTAVLLLALIAGVLGAGWDDVTGAGVLITLLATVASGVNYLWKARGVLFAD